CLIALKDSIGPTLCLVVWIVAALGILKKLFWLDAPRWISVGLYLAMGWMALVALPTLTKILPPMAIALLWAEGIFYTAGALIYAFQWPDPIPKVFGFHEIWHFFVLAGSASHFLLIGLYLIGPG